MKKRNDGLYQKQITITVNGKKKQKCFYAKTKAELDRKIMEYKGEQEGGRTFDAVSSEWWSQHERELAPNSIKGLLPAVKRSEEYFSGISIRDITASQVKAFINQFAAKGYAKKTVITQLQAVRQVLGYAMSNDELSHNVAEAVKLPKNLKQTKRKCPEDEVIEAIRERTDIPFALFAQFALYTGARRGEILALQYKDIDKDSKTISITKSVYHVSTVAQIKEPKTEAGKRSIALLPQLEALIPTGKPNDYIFVDESGAILSNGKFETAWKNYVKALGYKITPHQLRHYYATRLYELGIDVKTAQGLLGHDDVFTTQNIYTEIRKEKQLSVVDKLRDF